MVGDDRATGWRGYAPLVPVGSPPMSPKERQAWLDQRLWRPGPDLEVPTDTVQAAWIAPRLDPGSFLVQMMVPSGFEACARLFFPFGTDGPDITWTEMAQRTGRVPHALMEEETISTSADGSAPTFGADPEPSTRQVDRLLELLPAHTSSEVAWFVVWDGWGNLDERVFVGQHTIEHDMREYYLVRGPFDAFRDFCNLPSYWWPEDRSWIWCADTDFAWAYLAGPTSLIDQIVADPILDAYQTDLRNLAHAGMDTINDPDGTIRRQ